VFREQFRIVGANDTVASFIEDAVKDRLGKHGQVPEPGRGPKRSGSS
jgi:hypothetical protein